jgi:hypothetical protein
VSVESALSALRKMNSAYRLRSHLTNLRSIAASEDSDPSVFPRIPSAFASSLEKPQDPYVLIVRWRESC